MKNSFLVEDGIIYRIEGNNVYKLVDKEYKFLGKLNGRSFREFIKQLEYTCSLDSEY